MIEFRVVSVLLLGPIDVAPTVPSVRTTAQFGSPRLRCLLAALAVHSGEIVSVDQLADILWGDEQPTRPEASLHNLAFRLRSELRRAGLESVTVRTMAPGYGLTAKPTDLDVAVYADAIRSAATLLGPDPQAALDLVDDAEALWRGDPFGEFTDAHWVREAVGDLVELRLRGVEIGADALLSLGRAPDAVQRLSSTTVEHPYRESLHLRLMQALSSAHRPTDALAVYRSLRDRLAEDLGTEPDAALGRLHATILAGPEATAAAPRREHAELFGRRHDLAAVTDALAADRVVTVVGVGGVGKTALARELATHFGPTSWWWSELASVTDGPAVAPLVAAATGVRLSGDLNPVDGLADALSTAEGVVVLDNCEHVIDAAAVVASTLRSRCPGITVLATSRMPLGVDGERILPLEPLAAPGEIGDVGSSPAVQLLCARASSRDPDFCLTEANEAAVAEICRRLDGIPLSLELAATKMRALGPEVLAGRLEWRFRVLRGGVRATHPRHRSLHALVDWSYSLLGERERELFDMLWVFAGDFDLAAVEFVVAEVEGPATRDYVELRMSELVEVSMVAVRGGRYRLLETLRSFGVQQCTQGRDETLRRAHAGYVADRLAGRERDLWGPGHAAAAQMAAAMLDDVRRAMDWAVTHDRRLAIRILLGLLPYLELSMSTEVTGWARDLLRKSGDEHRRERAVVLAVAASGARFDGDLFAAGQRARDGLDCDPHGPVLVYLHMILLDVAMFQGDLDLAQEHTHRYRVAAADAGMPSVAYMARACSVLVDSYRDDADEPEAGSAHVIAVAGAAADAGDDVVASWCNYIAGEVLRECDPHRSVGLFDNAIEGSARTCDRYLQGVAMVSRASVELRAGDPSIAAGMFRDVVEHWRRSGNWTHQWVAMRTVVELLAHQGDKAGAARLLGAIRHSGELSGAGVYGEDEERLAGIECELTEVLGGDTVAVLMDLGAVLDPAAVVASSAAALDILSRSGSRGEFVETEEAEVVDG